MIWIFFVLLFAVDIRSLKQVLRFNRRRRRTTTTVFIEYQKYIDYKQHRKTSSLQPEQKDQAPPPTTKHTQNDRFVFRWNWRVCIHIKSIFFLPWSFAINIKSVFFLFCCSLECLLIFSFLIMPRIIRFCVWSIFVVHLKYVHCNSQQIQINWI